MPQSLLEMSTCSKQSLFSETVRLSIQLLGSHPTPWILCSLLRRAPYLFRKSTPVHCLAFIEVEVFSSHLFHRPYLRSVFVIVAKGLPPQGVKNITFSFIGLCISHGKTELFVGDPVGSLKGVTALAIAWLQEQNVNTVQEYFDFFYMKVPRRSNFVKAVKGMSMLKQLKSEAVAQQAIDGPPVVVDHRQHNVSVFCFNFHTSKASGHSFLTGMLTCLKGTIAMWFAMCFVPG